MSVALTDIFFRRMAQGEIEKLVLNGHCEGFSRHVNFFLLTGEYVLVWTMRIYYSINVKYMTIHIK